MVYGNEHFIYGFHCILVFSSLDVTEKEALSLGGPALRNSSLAPLKLATSKSNILQDITLVTVLLLRGDTMSKTTCKRKHLIGLRYRGSESMMAAETCPEHSDLKPKQRQRDIGNSLVF